MSYNTNNNPVLTIPITLYFRKHFRIEKSLFHNINNILILYKHPIVIISQSKWDIKVVLLVKLSGPDI